MCHKKKSKLDGFVGFRPWTRHSTVLLVAGLFYFFLGASYIIGNQQQSDGKTGDALARAVYWLSWDAWGSVWIIVGLLTILSTVWPPISKTWGYSIMTGLAAAWAGFYAVGVFLLDAPAWQISGALVWGFIAFMWWAISGLIDPDER